MSDIFDSIVELPGNVINGIKNIFIPDMQEIKDAFDEMILKAKTNLGINTSDFDGFSNNWNEKPVTDISSNYNISGVGTLNLKFLDSSYLVQGVEYFRPVIKGFIVFLLFFFNYRQLLSFIGQDPGTYAHAQENAERSSKK